jgi:hypothetical protein
MEAVSSSETSVPTKVTRHVPEDAILHSHHRENLKSYTLCIVCDFVLVSNTTYVILNG